jgi:hypothetical protein
MSLQSLQTVSGSPSNFSRSASIDDIQLIRRALQ